MLRIANYTGHSFYSFSSVTITHGIQVEEKKSPSRLGVLHGTSVIAIQEMITVELDSSADSS